MERKASLAETLTGLAVLVAVGAQTWVVLQEATQGDFGRQVSRWWQRKLRPAIVRVVLWIDAKSVVDRMIAMEIDPLLNGEI